MNTYLPLPNLRENHSNPHRRTLASSLRKILVSSDSSDVVSSEVVELIGFDDIELAMDIINLRHEVAEKVRLCIV